MQPEPVPAQVVIKEVKSLILDEECVSASVAALGQQHPLCPALRDHHLGCDAPGPVIGLGRSSKGNRRPTGVKDNLIPRTGDGRAFHVEPLQGAAVDGQHLVLARLCPPAADHLDQLVALLASQVVALGVILVQVVQLPVVGLDIQQHLVVDGCSEPAALLGGLGEARARPWADCPPAVVVDGAVAEHLEVLGVVVAGRRCFIEGMGEAHAIDGRLADAADTLRCLGAYGFQNCRHHVDGVCVMQSHLAAALNALGPGYDERIGGTPAVGLALPAAEGGVAGIGPAPGVVVVGFDAAQLIDHLEVVFQRFLDIVEEEHLVERAHRPAFGAGAVVGDDHDQRVVQLADLAQEIEDASKVMIGEARRSRRRPPCSGHRAAWPRLAGFPNRHIGVVRRQLGAWRDDPHIQLALVDDLAVLVPAHVELALVLVRPFLGHVVRGMSCARGVVQEERLIGCGDVSVLDELDRLVGQVAAQVVAFLRLPGLLDRVVVIGQLWEPLVGFAAQKTVVALEAAPERPAVVGTGCRGVFGGRQVPLADTEGVVAFLQQHLADHAPVEGQHAVVAGVTGGGLGNRGQPDRMVIAPGQDAATRR